MKSYPFKRRTVPKDTQSGGFSTPRMDTVIDHPVVVRERHFPPDAPLPTRGAATVPPTPDEGLSIFR